MATKVVVPCVRCGGSVVRQQRSTGLRGSRPFESWNTWSPPIPLSSTPDSLKTNRPLSSMACSRS